MYSKVNYSLIGSFILILVTAIVFFVLWLGDSKFKEDSKLYLLRTTESVSGLSKDSGVKLKGVNIGTVSDIRVNVKNIEEIEIILSLKKEIPIKEDMRAVISMFGLTGLAYIEILGGSNSSKTLVSENGKMPIIRSGISTVNDFKKKLNALDDRVGLFLDNMGSVLSDENIKNFSALIKNANSATVKATILEEKMTIALKESTTTIKEFRETFSKLSKNYNNLAMDLDNELPSLLENVNQTSTTIQKAATSIDSSISRGDYNFQKILQPSISSIKELSLELNALTRELKRSPSDILYKSRKLTRGPGE